MKRRRTVCRPLAGSFLLLMVACGAARAQTPAPAKNDYTNPANWLCRPGGPQTPDACTVDLAATVVAANGHLTREAWKASPNAPVDCFYVYPTVSADPTMNSDMSPGPEERRIVASQAARFQSQCRVYAPIYRQISLVGLRANKFGPIDGSDLLAHGPATAERAIAYRDVADAWRSYLERDNSGRGVVLIGHSQGAFLLAELIQKEIDGKPIQARLVSALLLGMSLPVPKGTDVGGAFQHVALCHAPTETGCVVSYATFRSTVPPPANALFGRVAGENMTSACTNPAALGGGRGDLHAYLNTNGHPFAASERPIAWVASKTSIDTPFVSVPGLLAAQCVSNEHGSYLEITVRGKSAGPRTDDIAGDVVTNGIVNPAWGLHLIDVNVALGDLVDLVRQQAAAYVARTQATKARKD